MKRIFNLIKIAYNKTINNPSKAYLIIALVGVIGFAFITPPFQGPDEEAHYNRVQYIAHGHFIPANVGGDVSLPASIDEVIHLVFFDNDIRGKTATHYELWRTKQALSKRLNSGEKFSPIMLNYNFLTYLPAVPGVFISNTLNLSPLISMYVARISLAITAVFIVYFAIKIIPIKKYLFVVLALIPMMLFQQAMIGTDGVSYAIFMLFLAYLFKLYTQKNDISCRQWTYFIVICGLVMWSKPLLYLFLPLSIILIKKKNFWRYIMIAGVVCVSMLGINQLMMSNQTSTGQAIGGQAGSPITVDSRQQTSLLFKNPKRFIRVMINSYLTHYGDDEIRGIIGTFGYADVHYPLWMSYVYISALTVAFLVGDNSNKFKKSKYHNLWVAFGILLCVLHFLAVNLAIYIGYTPVNFDIVYGVQGRYFLPALISGLLVLSVGGWSVSDKNGSEKLKKYIIVAASLLIILALFITYQRYFLFTP